MGSNTGGGSRQDSPVELTGFAAVPAQLVADPDLTHAELRALLALAAHAGPDNTCWPGVPRLARILSVCERQARRILLELIHKGYVEKQHRRSSTGAQTSNAYRLRFARWGSAPADNFGPAPDPGHVAPQELQEKAGPEDLDTNAHPPGHFDQGPPDIPARLTTKREPGQLHPLNPPQVAGDSPPVGRQGLGRTTRKEKDLINRLAGAIFQTCHGCGEQIGAEEIAERDTWGRLVPSIARVSVSPVWEPAAPSGPLVDVSAGIARLVEAGVLSVYDRNNWFNLTVEEPGDPGAPLAVWFDDAAHRDWVQEHHPDAMGRIFPGGYVPRVLDVRPPPDCEEVIHVQCVEDDHRVRPYLSPETPKARKARRAAGW